MSANKIEIKRHPAVFNRDAFFDDATRIFEEPCSPAERDPPKADESPLRSNPDGSGSTLRSDKLATGNALAIAVQAND
ncbi:MAG: hypothetical protein JRJ46_02065 [Deltaproteobacteria bacterium]|nr:hypothetical protein [Deltaproteobacteria bacterium]